VSALGFVQSVALRTLEGSENCSGVECGTHCCKTREHKRQNARSDTPGHRTSRAELKSQLVTHCTVYTRVDVTPRQVGLMHTLALSGRASFGVLPYPIVWIFKQLSLLWLISNASWPLYSRAYTGLNRIMTN
jgi:hypothetical protein